MILKRIINTIFPRNYTCLCCRNDVYKDGEGFCSYCKDNLPYLKGKLCKRCSNPIKGDGNYCDFCKGKKLYFDYATSPLEYTGKAKSLVRKLKYDGRKDVARPMAKLMAEKFMAEGLSADIILPVPLCEKRFKERGFNQSERLANNLSTFLNINTRNDVLFRVRETPVQTHLNYIDRQKNLQDAFKVRGRKYVNGKVVLLIDDVYTTGATATECAKALKGAGAKFVIVLTFCHTIFKS